MNGKISRQPESRIPLLSPAPLRRSGSLRLGACPPIQEHHSNVILRPTLNRHRSLQSLNTASSFGCEQEDDADSVKSFSSTASVCSNLSQCDHANFARNGTTYSGRCKRYVVHCSPHSTETDDYLTPTQRTNRTIRKLRSLLKDAQAELVEKDKEIMRLTKEVVELRLLKVDSGIESNGVEDDARLDQSHADLVQSDSPPSCSSQHTSSPQPRYCSSPPLAQSLSDSGHFEDLNSSKDVSHATQSHINHIKTLESIQRQYEDEIRELKERHNDKVDLLLQRITDVNDRYYALRPLYEDCKEKLHELGKLNEELNQGQCQRHISKIAELETLVEELLRDKQSLVVEIDNINQVNNELELLKLNHDTLEIENIQLKKEKDILIEALNNVKQEICTSCLKKNNFSSSQSCQTEELELQNVHKGHSEVNQPVYDSCEHHMCSFKLENSELKLQIVAHIEKMRQLEKQEHSEKDIYAELYKKGIQAAKLMGQEETETGQTAEKESSLIPDLLQKLRIQQEELDNVKDKDYISPDNLLSAKEAVSLWKLARKSMYRRLLETRKCQPKHDPEMTLQFLKSAFFYFLTDKENAPGHLSAIESILGFTENEKINIEKAFLWR